MSTPSFLPFLFTSILFLHLGVSALANPIYAGMDGEADRNVATRCQFASDLHKFAIARLPGPTPERSTRFNVRSNGDLFFIEITTLISQCERSISHAGEFEWITVEPTRDRDFTAIGHGIRTGNRKFSVPLTSRVVGIPHFVLPGLENLIQTEASLSIPFRQVLTERELHEIALGNPLQKRFDVRVPVNETRSLNFLYFVDVEFSTGPQGTILASIQ